MENIRFEVLKDVGDFFKKEDSIYKKDLLVWFTNQGINCLVKDGVLEQKTAKKEKGFCEMFPGKIYYVSYGGTELIIRYKSSDTCNHHCYSELHYWNGYETYNKSDYFVKNGIEEIREASQTEKFALFQKEIENGDS